MTVELTGEQWGEIDALILTRDNLHTLKRLRKWLGVSLREAMEIHFERYEHLRRTRPDDFPCSDEEFWEGVYS